MSGANDPEPISFPVRGEYVELAKLLKATGLVATGGEAKIAVGEGQVRVDGEVETRRRRKVRPGQVVEFDGETIRVTGPADDEPA